MSLPEVTISTRTMSGLCVADPQLLSLLSGENFGPAWEQRETIKKEGDRCVAIIRNEDGAAYLIKSFCPGLRKKLSACISMPLFSLHRNLEVLKLNDIPVARSLAVFSWRRDGKPERWCQIQEYLHDSITLDQALTELYGDDHEQKMALIAETVTQLGRLHKLGRYHGDMKLTNIMVREQAIVLVDTNGRRSVRLRRWHQKDLARFMVGLRQAHVEPPQLTRAIDLYRQHSGNSEENFMSGVHKFAEKISRRHAHRYGAPTSGHQNKGVS